MASDWGSEGHRVVGSNLGPALAAPSANLYSWVVTKIQTNS